MAASLPSAARDAAVDGPVAVEEHLRDVLDLISPMTAFDQPLLEGVGLPVAADVVSSVALPMFDNSSMDGYAVAFRDVAEATQERPIYLPVVGEILAGSNHVPPLTPGTTVEIMTGAKIPAGATAVVPFEWTERLGHEVCIRTAPESGQHIRREGEEISRGQVLLQAGETLGTRQVGLLAAAGVGRVRVTSRPRVVVMSTGAELVPPGHNATDTQIFDANSYLLASAVRAHGGIPFRVTVSSDEPRDFIDELSDHLVRADLIITTGGVSKGTRDVVKEVLSSLGTVTFREVGMQPGKPQGFGTVGEERIPIVTLPGNPVSAYVSFAVFCVPALRKLVGCDPVVPPTESARLDRAIVSVAGKRQYLRGATYGALDGLRVRPVGGAGSHLVGGLAQADALIVVDENVVALDSGAVVPVLPLEREG